MIRKILIVSSLIFSSCEGPKSYTEEIKKVIKEIDKSSKVYLKNTGKWALDISDLERANLINIERGIKLKWVIDMELNGGFIDEEGGWICATSTEEMPGGSRNQLVYYTHTEQFSGYGTSVPKQEINTSLRIICKCLTENDFYNQYEINCDQKINDRLGHNWKTTNYSKSISESEKFDKLANICNRLN